MGDPGRAPLLLESGADIGKAKRVPFSEDSQVARLIFTMVSAATLAEVLVFYDMRFQYRFYSPGGKPDLIAFLNSP